MTDRVATSVLSPVILSVVEESNYNNYPIK